jgi:hypothetical protein
MKKASLFLCTAALTLLFGCDLLLDKPEGDLMHDVAEAVDYAKAPSVNARVGIMSGTVGMVTMDVSDKKVGYSFDVQATANPGYGFGGWVALRSADWDARPAGGGGRSLCLAKSRRLCFPGLRC